MGFLQALEWASKKKPTTRLARDYLEEVKQYFFQIWTQGS
jgi:hypothetical protein